MQPIANPIIDKNWRVRDFQNKDNVTIDDVKFIFAQAEKRMDDGIKNFDAATTKSISLITLTATLLTALSAYLFINFDPDTFLNARIVTVMVCWIYTGIVLYRVVAIILPKAYEPIGSYPQDLYTESLFVDPPPSDGKSINKNTLWLYLTEMQSYNYRIYVNDKTNIQRLDRFNESTRLICAMPVFGIVVYASVLALGYFLDLSDLSFIP